jgi:release factor glutamine methyltransferase
VRTRIGRGSWFEALPADLMGSIGVIASNPPYIAAGEDLSPAVSEWEPSLALVPGPTGTEALEIIIDVAPQWLVDSGSLVLEMSPWQTDAIAERASQRFIEVEVFDDLNGLPRGVVARILRR